MYSWDVSLSLNWAQTSRLKMLFREYHTLLMSNYEFEELLLRHFGLRRSRSRIRKCNGFLNVSLIQKNFSDVKTVHGSASEEPAYNSQLIQLQRLTKSSCDTCFDYGHVTLECKGRKNICLRCGKWSHFLTADQDVCGFQNSIKYLEDEVMTSDNMGSDRLKENLKKKF